MPEVPSFLSDSELSLLQTLIDPLQECDDFGKRLYVAARQIVREGMA